MRRITTIVTLLLLVFTLFAAKEKLFTKEELSHFDGKNGRKAYIAVDGVVYDVTGQKQWKNGRHKMGVKAGTDASNKIGKSPHGKAILTSLPIVGKLVTSKPKQKKNIKPTTTKKEK